MVSQDSSGNLIPHISDFGLAIAIGDNVVKGFQQGWCFGLSSGYAAPEIYSIFMLVKPRPI